MVKYHTEGVWRGYSINRIKINKLIRIQSLFIINVQLLIRKNTKGSITPCYALTLVRDSNAAGDQHIEALAIAQIFIIGREK